VISNVGCPSTLPDAAFQKEHLGQALRIAWSHVVKPFQPKPLIPENGADPAVLSLDSVKQLR
jgi:hypothetical protein